MNELRSTCIGFRAGHRRRCHVRHRAGRRRDRGLTLLETLVALTLAGVLLAVSMQMLTAAARQQASEECRRAAVREAANAVEQLGTVAYDELTPERLDRLEAAWALDDVLPGAALELDIEPAEGPPAGKRVVVTVRWADTGGPTPPPVTLVRWRYR